jgi:glycosyltransferase involved in cell wall biosynthesis
MSGVAPDTAPDVAPAAARSDGRRVALVHHWLVRRRGGERVLEAVAAAFPGADLYTLVHDRRAVSPPAGIASLRTSPLQRVPFALRARRLLAPLHRRAYRALDLGGHDLVLSCDAALAKCVRVPPGVPHVCLCFSPPRWAFDLREVSLRADVPAPLRPLARALLARVRRADVQAAAAVTRFVAISQHVADRIARHYGRESVVIHPPVDVDSFTPGPPDPGSAPDGQRPYLMLGEFVPYKRFAAGILACRALDRPLIVAGDGPDRRALMRLAGPRTRFVRDPDDAAVAALYRSCRALLFPGEEDFGLVPLEAMACGRPVVALGRGGATETVQDGRTGVLYEPPPTDGLPAEAGALQAGLRRFESIEAGLAPRHARARAEEFSTARFQAALHAVVEDVIEDTLASRA